MGHEKALMNGKYAINMIALHSVGLDDPFKSWVTLQKLNFPVIYFDFTRYRTVKVEIQTMRKDPLSVVDWLRGIDRGFFYKGLTINLKMTNKT